MMIIIVCTAGKAIGMWMQITFSHWRQHCAGTNIRRLEEAFNVECF
jgi:hypothetical protein